ncbi:Glutamate--tRNA ligase [Neolewinella maritima]|uniref:Glutamate--tRNA ligase n=1 Tax=Neolewinella maritima TaxID=1383882 RepID=A0ABM9B4W3_9BACT|nr:glutamate--tRNA ligase family protein [Neolewinella maritima]CAH1002330.1 Glutamate--tRNA ligase [Neolewinella maritima]
MTRIAPTPSGYLHLGNAANFAANALLAARTDGRLLLRIDDLDRARVRPAYLQDVFDVLDWLGIEPTEGPRDVEDFTAHWSQEHRMPLYRAALETLRTRTAPNGPQLFACPCSRKELADGVHFYDCPTAGIALAAPQVAWRIDTRGLPLHAQMPDFAVRKKDGRPSYQLACTVDDYHYRITTCARGEDLRASTAAQAVVSDLLGYPKLEERMDVIHHPLLLHDGGKLSKSQGAGGVRELGVSRKEVFAIAKAWLHLPR